MLFSAVLTFSEYLYLSQRFSIMILKDSLLWYGCEVREGVSYAELELSEDEAKDRNHMSCFWFGALYELNKESMVAIKSLYHRHRSFPS